MFPNIGLHFQTTSLFQFFPPWFSLRSLLSSVQVKEEYLKIFMNKFYNFWQADSRENQQWLMFWRFGEMAKVRPRSLLVPIYLMKPFVDRTKLSKTVHSTRIPPGSTSRSKTVFHWYVTLSVFGNSYRRKEMKWISNISMNVNSPERDQCWSGQKSAGQPSL